ncbi:MAG: winged helix-turn-helix domain-containing protein, partial [Candidatus Aenigmatarchaeota archaeon]
MWVVEYLEITIGEDIIMGNNTRDKILNLLEERKEGLTIKEISNSVNKHRHTVAKYLSKLKKEGKILQRDVGSAKLFYLSKVLNEDDTKGARHSFEKGDYNKHILLFSTTFLLLIIALSNIGGITGLFLQPTHNKMNVSVHPQIEMPQLFRLNKTNIKEFPLDFSIDLDNNTKVLSSDLIIEGRSDGNTKLEVLNDGEKICQINTGRNDFSRRCNLDSMISKGSFPSDLSLNLRFKGANLDVSETPTGLMISNKTGGDSDEDEGSQEVKKPKEAGKKKEKNGKETSIETTVEEKTTSTVTSVEETSTTSKDTTTSMIEETTTIPKTSTTKESINRESTTSTVEQSTTTTEGVDTNDSTEVTTTILENDTEELTETTTSVHEMDNKTSKGSRRRNKTKEGVSNETTTTTVQNETISVNRTESTVEFENLTNETQGQNITVNETTTTVESGQQEIGRNKTNKSKFVTIQLTEVKLLLTYENETKRNETNITNETGVSDPSINRTTNETLPGVVLPNQTNRTNVTRSFPSIFLNTRNRTVNRNRSVTFTVNETSGQDLIRSVNITVGNFSYRMSNNTEKGNDYWIYEWVAFNETGDYTVTAEAFDGDLELLNTSSINMSIVERNLSEEVTVPSIDFSISRNPLNISENTTFYVNETSGEELIENVTININGSDYQMYNNTTSGKNYWSMNWTAFNKTGNYTAIAEALDVNNSLLTNSTVRVIVASLTNITNVTNVTENTVLNLSMNDTVEKGDILEVETKLYGVNRTPLKDKIVHLFLDSELRANNFTGSDGTSGFKINTTDLILGKHTVNGSYYGNETLNLSPSYSYKTFDVVP